MMIVVTVHMKRGCNPFFVIISMFVNMCGVYNDCCYFMLFKKNKKR